MSQIIKLVKDKEPIAQVEKPVKCWLFHQWGKWRRINSMTMEHECIKCGFIKEKHTW